MCINFFKKNKEPEFNPGALESPLDNRDIALSVVQAKIEHRELPEAYMVPYKLRISDQGITPHCVGYSAATMKEEKERREKIPVDFDGDWLYNECKKIDGYSGDGTYLRTVFQVLKNVGAKPLGGSESDAANYKIGAYAALDDISIEGIKRAIYENGVIQVLFKGTKAGWSYLLKGYIRTPKAGETIWGHAVALIGWNKNNLIGQNSWGSNWGDGAFFYFDEKYPIKEGWAILVDLPSDFKFAKKPEYAFLNDLKLGMKNEEVKMLQECLKYEDCFPIKIESTGLFGSVTLGAVKKFQEKYSIIPTAGYVGTITRTKLNQLFSKVV